MSLPNLLSPADAQITHICTFQLIAAERSPIVQITAGTRAGFTEGGHTLCPRALRVGAVAAAGGTSG